jgi:hypothetical protein
VTESARQTSGGARRPGSRLEALLRSPLPLLAILAIAAWLRWGRLELRFNQITFAYAAYFEPYLAAWQAHDVRRLLTTFIGLHPPLYSAMHAALYTVWGAPAGFHLLSGALSVTAVWVTFLLGRSAYGHTAGLAAAALLAVSTYHLHYGLEVNNYPLLVLTSALSQRAFLRALERPGRRETCLWALTAAAALYTHALAALLVALNALAFLAVHRGRHLKPLLAASGSILLICLPLAAPVIELTRRGSTYHNEALAWGALWTLVVRGMSFRFGPPALVGLLMLAAGIGLVRGLRRPAERPASLALGLSLLAAPIILGLSRAGIAAAHQYPYYLLVLPSFLVLAARGFTSGRSAPPALAPVPALRLTAGPLALTLAVTAGWEMARAEQLEADRAVARFSGQAHAVKVALIEARAGDVLWLIAPALYPDDDKRAVDPVYQALPAWSTCRYHQPRDLRFEFVDYSYGQPVTCGDLTLYTFTDVYGSSMTRLLRYERSQGHTVRIVLYDVETTPDYPARLEAVLQPFHASRRSVGASVLYAVAP